MIDAFENTTTLPLPGDVVGAVEELNGSKRVFEGFRGHGGGRYGVASFLTRVFVSESCTESVGGRKEQGLDIAGPRAYCLALLELAFDARKNDRRRFVEVFAWRLRQRAHNLLKIDPTTERERRERERARQRVAIVVVMVQCEKKLCSYSICCLRM